EAAAVLPRVGEVLDRGEREAVILEASDQAHPGEMARPVEADPAPLGRRWEQPPGLVHADGRHRDAALVRQVLDRQPIVCGSFHGPILRQVDSDYYISIY